MPDLREVGFTEGNILWVCDVSEVLENIALTVANLVNKSLSDVVDNNMLINLDRWLGELLLIGSEGSFRLGNEGIESKLRRDLLVNSYEEIGGVYEVSETVTIVPNASIVYNFIPSDVGQEVSVIGVQTRRDCPLSLEILVGNMARIYSFDSEQNIWVCSSVQV